MRTWTVTLLLALSACATVTPTPLEGGWQSNRDLTLAELRRSKTFTQGQLETLTAPDFFGQMIHVYRGGELLTVFRKECSAPRPFEILRSDPHSVTLRIHDEAWGADKTVQLDLDGDRLYVPMSIAKTDMREVFTRVPVAEIAERHPCTRAFVEK